MNRVRRPAFFARFEEANAVRYFYEPFLAAYDPELRREFGVWYTPREIVRYMVERVDQVLRSELGLAAGLADPSVWVLDPCCGTGAYLVEVLDRIARTLRARGEDALTAQDLKDAAMTRIAGFEIMPAPYVIAHWQIGHALRAAGAPLGAGERAAVYLTNALTGWAAPQEAGTPEPAQQGLREGIQVGTAIALLVKQTAADYSDIQYRDLWGTTKRTTLLANIERYTTIDEYHQVTPNKGNRFSLRPSSVCLDYSSWPSLADMAADNPTPGLLEMRREALIDADAELLATRMRRYFNHAISLDELREAGCGPVIDMARFPALKARDTVMKAETFKLTNIRPYQLRPFETVWCYHTNTRPIWNEPRPELAARVRDGNPCLVSRAYRERPNEGPHIWLTKALPDYHLLGPDCSSFSFFSDSMRANLSAPIRAWLDEPNLATPDDDHSIAALPWHHALAIGYAPAWLAENADGIRQDWPRVPLPDTADLLRASAALGARVATLLDPDTAVPGVTAGDIAPALLCLGVPSKRGRGGMTESDRELTAGWGHAGKNGAVMPGRGSLVLRDYAANEAAAAAVAPLLGQQTYDIYLNADAYWCNVPQTVWAFTIGGYQVIKKFLSYRERPLLGRALTGTEIRYVRDMIRRLAALRLMQPELDANYRRCAAAHRPLT